MMSERLAQWATTFMFTGLNDLNEFHHHYRINANNKII